MKKSISIVSILLFFLGIVFLALYRNFINSNEAFFSTIFALIIATATVFYAVLTWLLVEENIKMRKIQTSPKISLEIAPQDRWRNFIDFEINNIGNGIAKNLKFEIVNGDKNPLTEILKEMDFIKNGISYLSPKKTIKTFLTSLAERMEDKLKPFSIKIRYQDSLEKENFCDEFHFNLSYLKGMSSLGEPPLYKISKNIEKMGKDIGNLATGFKKLNVITQTKKEKREEDKKQIEKIKALQKKKT